MTDQISESTWSQKQLAEQKDYLSLNKQVFEAALLLGAGYRQLKNFVENMESEDKNLAKELGEGGILARAYRAVQDFVASVFLLGDNPSAEALKKHALRIIHIKSADVEEHKPTLITAREGVACNAKMAPWEKPYLHDYLIKEVFLPAAEKGHAMMETFIVRRENDAAELHDIQEYFTDAAGRLQKMLETYREQQEARRR